MKRLFITLMLIAIAVPAYAIDLPAFDANICKGEQSCIEQLNTEYTILALKWRNINEADEVFCLKHEEYAKHYSGIYYDALNNCITAKDFQRGGIQ